MSTLYFYTASLTGSAFSTHANKKRIDDEIPVLNFLGRGGLLSEASCDYWIDRVSVSLLRGVIRKCLSDFKIPRVVLPRTTMHKIEDVAGRSQNTTHDPRRHG